MAVDTWQPKEPRVRWAPGSPRRRGTFGGHTLECLYLPEVEILNLNCVCCQTKTDATSLRVQQISEVVLKR